MKSVVVGPYQCISSLGLVASDESSLSDAALVDEGKLENIVITPFLYLSNDLLSCPGIAWRSL